jgi:anti-sigma regulatory factor (Ser/Thr protein kinase)
MEKKFTREIQSLEEIFQFTDKFVAENAVDKEVVFSLNLIIEELFTNMVKYNPGNPNDIFLSLFCENHSLIITLIDYDVEPFDITHTKDHNPRQPLQDRRIGGLGIPFIKKMVDKITYEYENRCSKITLVKHLGKTYV